MDTSNFPDADGDFSNAPIFNFNDGQVKFDDNWVDNANANYGSASAFVPKSLHIQKVSLRTPFALLSRT